MTQKLSALILLAALMAFGCPATRAASQGDCLSYEPASVKLTGRVIRKVFPGRPNYESIKDGDEPEPAWILHLAKPICVKADGKEEFNVAVGKVSDLHLVLRGKQFSQLRRLRRKGAVTLTGTLFHSFTGHHHTEVLMEVKSIKGQ
jgi:hypothetical protein